MRADMLCVVQIHFLGATRTTTSSMDRLEINGQRLLLECGLFQGRREASIELNRNFPFDPKTLDAVGLNHAHIASAARDETTGRIDGARIPASGFDLTRAR